MMSTVFSGQEPKIQRLRKRPKETSSKAKTSPQVFGAAHLKKLRIPAIADGYNYGMGEVDDFDHLTAQNAGLRHVERVGHQAIKNGSCLEESAYNLSSREALLITAAIRYFSSLSWTGPGLNRVSRCIL
ncbi:hypothetical protein BJ878DRAFT_433913 [Calycina marina]|uniref:Uncharacterized protein n=1 Tax=Calycina marina TaxID=1763456 RepID=A0A9P7ZA03_9HELO|nr:hypothetical protein BJ878DRAFT_433913 [Calycina marina]